MPRTYRLGHRAEGWEQTRSRILAAARELLIATDGFSSFSMEAVARRADVARMTVYHQFGSKIGLLEAICDTLAASGGMEQMASAFSRPDPLDALDEYIAVFGRFWQSDRLLTRRLRGLAALDPEFEQVIRARDERRRQGLRVLVARLGERHELERDQVIDILYTLIAFEFFDTLAGPSRSPEDVVPIVAKLARAALDL
ncbi:MAG: TetR/AcrR family transcriptional regulator [Chloroflexi bacterium]|nr:MAG: TetR/AcrR family transcriptional regulator [Chloroflexota bacterium]